MKIATTTARPGSSRRMMRSLTNRPKRTKRNKMPKLLFRGAYVRFVDLRFDDKSKTTYTKLNFTASFSEPIREAMEWGAPPPGFSSAKLDGSMTATHLVLTPNGRELKTHELQLDAREISGFEFHRVKDGESRSEEPT